MKRVLFNQVVETTPASVFSSSSASPVRVVFDDPGVSFLRGLDQAITLASLADEIDSIGAVVEQNGALFIDLFLE